MHRTIVPLVMTALAAVPAGTALAANHTAATSVTKKFSGPLEDMRWGPVRATISVKNKKITGVKILTSPENSRSQFIDSQAVPLLKQETLQAQNSNINLISGATMTSDAYQQSLQSAIQKAVKAKALKSTVS